MLSTLALLVFPVLMVYAAASDLFTMRIANWLVIALALAYPALALLAQLSWTEIGTAFAVAAAVLAVTFGMFAAGWIGGGDAKLAAATAPWLGLGLLLPYLIYSALLGGALTLLILAVRSRPLPVWMVGHKWIDRLHDSKTGIPYGIALAAAAVLVYPSTRIFQGLLTL